MKHLYKKELNFYLNNPVGYIVVVLFAIFANFLFVKDIFLIGSASMRPFFATIPWLLMVFIPALTMRSLSEEKRTNSIEILLSLPLSETEIVLAKFFALLSFLVIGLGLTVGLPISLMSLTRIYLPEVFVGYLGVVLIGMSFISIGLFFSARTKNQVVAFLLSIIITFFLLVLSTEFTASVLPKFIQDFFSYFSPVYHLQNFIKGVVDIRSLFYFISLMMVFLFLTVIELEKRN